MGKRYSVGFPVPGPVDAGPVEIVQRRFSKELILSRGVFNDSMSGSELTNGSKVL